MPRFLAFSAVLAVLAAVANAQRDGLACRNIFCPTDVCSDGQPRRRIGDDCCACPERDTEIPQSECSGLNNGAGCEEGWVCKMVNVTVQCFTDPCPQLPMPTCQQDCSRISCEAIDVCPNGGKPRTPENGCCPQCPCNLRCPSGFQTDANGAEICACAENPVTRAPTRCFETAPCRRFCPYGFQTDEQGCAICECNMEPAQTTPPSSSPTNRAVSCPDVMCAMYCENGFQTNEETGCPICQCTFGKPFENLFWYLLSLILIASDIFYLHA